MTVSFRWVLDASAALHVVMRQSEAAPLIDRLEQSTLVLVPHLYFSECANGLWKYVAHGSLTQAEAVQRYEEICALPDEVIDDRTLGLEALTLAALHRHPVYDLIYAVLARRHACGVLTRDRRLAALLTGLEIDVFPPP